MVIRQPPGQRRNLSDRSRFGLPDNCQSSWSPGWRSRVSEANPKDTEVPWTGSPETTPSNVGEAETPRPWKGSRPVSDSAGRARALYSVPEAMALLSLSRTQIYELIRVDRLLTVTQGRRRLVPVQSIEDYVLLLVAESKSGGHGRAA